MKLLMDLIGKLLNKSSNIQHPHPLLVINDPKGIVVAKRLAVDDLKRYMYEENDFPGLCPYCHFTLEKVPNLEFRTRTKKDIVWTYDGFYVVSERFRRFCDEQGFKDLIFIPLRKSPGHYYFEPAMRFPIDFVNTIFEHEGEPCPKCGNYKWFGGPHRIYSERLFEEDDNFICRTPEYFGDRDRKFFLIIVGLKTYRLMKEYGFSCGNNPLYDVHYLNNNEPSSKNGLSKDGDHGVGEGDHSK